MTIRTGATSTEHWRAWRAEAVGISLVLAGLIGVFVFGWPGVALCAVGVWLLGWTGASYAASRGGVKAAAERPRVVQAPK